MKLIDVDGLVMVLGANFFVLFLDFRISSLLLASGKNVTHGSRFGNHANVQQTFAVPSMPSDHVKSKSSMPSEAC